jgi:hypothetical protein
MSFSEISHTGSPTTGLEIFTNRYLNFLNHTMRVLSLFLAVQGGALAFQAPPQQRAGRCSKVRTFPVEL